VTLYTRSKQREDTSDQTELNARTQMCNTNIDVNTPGLTNAIFKQGIFKI